MLKSFFNKVAGVKAINFILKRFQTRCFSVNIARFLRTRILRIIWGWLLLYSEQVVLEDDESTCLFARFEKRLVHSPQSYILQNHCCFRHCKYQHIHKYLCIYISDILIMCNIFKKKSKKLLHTPCLTTLAKSTMESSSVKIWPVKLLPSEKCLPP